MELKVKEVLVNIRKYFLCALKSTSKFTCRHPFAASFAFSLLFMYSFYPSLFAFLVSSFPVLFCTALLLGILLSYGEPNIPEIEEDDNTSREVSLLKVENSVDDLFVQKDESFTLEDLVDSRVGTAEKISKDSAPYGEKEREIDFFAVSTSVEEHNKVAENLELLMKEQSVSYMRLSEVADTASEGIEGLMVKIKKPELDDWLDSSLGRPWQPINVRDSSDSESDRAESSSPDASMADILPMLDELSPLLDSEAPHNDPKSADNSDLELSQHPESDEDSVEKEDEYKPEEKDESNKVVTWTADDLKNVMDLGSSDLERNRRLESLIARRRARKNQIIIFEKDLIDLHSEDTTMDELFRFHPQIPPIFAPRGNPFDLPHDLDKSKGFPPIPGSAPSVMLRQQNPFDFPCDSEEGNKGLVGESLHQPEFGLPYQRGYLFRRHESFASHSAFPSNLMHEKLGSSRLNPCFAAESMESESNDYVDFHDQLNGESDTKSRSVPTLNTISSAIDSEDHKVPTEQEIPEGMVLSVPLQHTKPTEQYGQFYEDDLVDSQPELVEDGHSADPNASAVTAETDQGIDSYGFVKKTIAQKQFGQNHEEVEEKHDDLTLFSSSERIEKNFDISLDEVEYQEQITRVSEASSEPMHSSDASASHLICETEAFDNNQAAVPIYDSSPSGSGNFLANISVSGDNLLSSGGEGLHSVSVKSHVQEDAVEVVSHAKELEKSMTAEMIEFNVVNGNKLQDSTSCSGETVTFPTYMNLLDENRSAAMGVFETGGEQGFNESNSPKIDEDFGDLATTLEIDHSSGLSSTEAGNEPRFAFSASFPPSDAGEKHQSMEEFEMQTSFGIYLEESRVSNLELGPIPEENSEDFKVQEEDMSLVQAATTFASSGMLILETPDVSLSSVGQEVIFLHNQSKEEARDDGSEDLVFLSEKAKPSNGSNPVSANDVIFNDGISDSQDDIINEFQINQDVILMNLNGFHSEHDDVDADIGEIQVIDEHLLLELDAVGDFQVEGLNSQEYSRMESQSDSQFVCSGEDSEMSPNKPTTASLINPDEMDLVLNTEEPTDSGYWSLSMSPVEDLTVYNPKLNVLEACSPLQLDSIFKQEHLGELVEPPLSNPISGKLVTENSYVGLRSFDVADQEIEAMLQEAVLLTLAGKNDEDISSALVEDGRDFDISVSSHFDFQHSDYHSSMDGCKSDLTVVDACGYDSTEIQSSEIKADHIESVRPSASHPSAIAEAETSSGELDTSSRDFERVETDSELLVLEAKSIEDIHVPFKHVTEIVVNKSISPLINTEPMITHPVDPVVEVISPEVEKTSGLLVLEAKCAEDINSAFKQAAEEGLATSAVHYSDLEKMTNHTDFEVMETSSPGAEKLSELFVLEARSAEDIQLAFKKVTEEVSAVSASSLTDSEQSKTNQDHEVVEAMYPETHYNRELLVPEGKSSEDIDSSFEQADVDLDKPTSQVYPWLLVNRIDCEVVDVKSLETQIDQKPLIPDAKYIEKNDSSFKLSSEGSLLRSTSLEIDPNHDAVKNESLQASTDSEQLVLEAESVEETSSALNQVTEGLFDRSSPLVVPKAAGVYEVADMISLGLENDSDMLFFETKSSQHLNSACKQDIDIDLVKPNLQELGNFQTSHDTVDEKPLNLIDKPASFILESKSSEDTNSVSNEVGMDFIVQSTTALVDPGHSPEQAVLDVKSHGPSNISEFQVPEAKSLEILNLASRQAIEGRLSKAESEVDTQHDSVGESFLAADLFSEQRALDEKSAENIQSTFLDAHAGVHEGSASLPVDLEPMEIHPGRQVEDNMCFEAENNSDMLVVEAKSFEDIHSAFKQATDVATSPLPVESRSLDIQTELNSLVQEAKSVELTDSSMKKVHQEGSKKYTFFTDASSLQANSDDDSGLLVLGEKPDIDSTFTEVTEECLDGSVTPEDDSKQTGTIPEPKPVTDGNLDANQDAEVDYAKETTVVSNEAVTVENSSTEDKINRRTDEEQASTENPSSGSPPSVKIKKNNFEKSDPSSSSTSSSSDSE